MKLESLGYEEQENLTEFLSPPLGGLALNKANRKAPN